MRRFVTVLLLVTTCVVLLSWKGTIQIWDFPAWSEEGDNYAWIKRMMSQFSQMYPGVEFKLTEIPWSGGDQKLDLAVASKKWPDLTRGPLRTHYIVQGALQSVDEYLTEEEKADYYPEAIKGASYEGKMYGFPFYMTTKVVILNKKIFEERSVPIPSVEDPWTFDEFYAIAKKLTFDRDGDGKIDVYGFVAGGFPSPDNSHLWPFILNFGGKFVEGQGRELRSAMVNEQNKEALEKLAKVFAECAPPFMASYGDADAYTLFRSGKGAIYVAGTWAIPALVNAGLEIEIAPYPVKNKGDKSWSFGDVSSYQIFIQNDKDKLDTLIAFAKYITSAEQQKELVKYGQFPTKKSVGNIYKDDSLMSKAYLISQNNYVFPPHPAKERIMEAISREIQLALLGKKDVKKALEDADKTVTRIIESTMKK
ncbi:MAG: sugar ABC transporter substrate-binding protein [Pseudothermotoga sp.]|nr:sugar ABC transporter substrate-binding protein [Pseudothermotoga sp.]